MIAHPNPKTVFIGGGGEGGTLREVLRHPCVEKAVMVDIDGDLVDIFKSGAAQYPKGAKAAFEDPRTVLIYDDARKQLEAYDGYFDVIILDLADPVECGPCFELWTKEFFQLCIDKMAPGGVLATQAGPFSVNQITDVCTPVAKTLGAVFPTVLTYGAHVPSFGHTWAFHVAWKDSSGDGYAERSPAAVDEALSHRLGVAGAEQLGWYDGLTHHCMFSLPKPVSSLPCVVWLCRRGTAVQPGYTYIACVHMHVCNTGAFVELDSASVGGGDPCGKPCRNFLGALPW